MQKKLFFELLVYKTRANLRAEVSRLYLNYAWWVLEPLFTFGVMYVVFGVFMHNPMPHFALFLLIGLVQWQWFANTTLHAAGSIRGAAGLMLQANIPKIFFPLEVFLQDSFKHLFVILLFAVFLCFYPIPITSEWVALPLLFLLQGFLVVTVCILFAALVPFVPDLQQVFATIINIMFFVSGIFFDPSVFVLPQHLSYLYANPMAGLLREYRRIIISGQWPDWEYLAYLALGTFFVLCVTLIFIRRCDRLYPRICQQ